MNLITNIKNVPEKNFIDLIDINYDKNGRYLKLNQDLKDIFSLKRHEKIPKNRYSIIHQTITSDSSCISIEERFNSIANKYNVSTLFINKQYELAFQTRLEIPPILMRRILIDAIGIYRLMINELNHENKKLEKMTKHLRELEIYNELFNQHC